MEQPKNERGERMLDSLPAIYRTEAYSGPLQRLLGAFEAVLFDGTENSPGIEQQIEAIPALFSPQGDDYTEPLYLRNTPQRFLPWLATWVAFTPYALFAPEQLRNIISGIAPLYSIRGTRTYLEKLLKLCFPEIRKVEINESPVNGFVIGEAKIGEDTLFGRERPFWFRVAIDAQSQGPRPEAAEPPSKFERRVRVIIDFAKPAHTAYELRLNFSADDSGSGSGSGRYTV